MCAGVCMYERMYICVLVTLVLYLLFHIVMILYIMWFMHIVVDIILYAIDIISLVSENHSCGGKPPPRGHTIRLFSILTRSKLSRWASKYRGC